MESSPLCWVLIWLKNSYHDWLKLIWNDVFKARWNRARFGGLWFEWLWQWAQIDFQWSVQSLIESISLICWLGILNTFARRKFKHRNSCLYLHLACFRFGIFDNIHRFLSVENRSFFWFIENCHNSVIRQVFGLFKYANSFLNQILPRHWVFVTCFHMRITSVSSDFLNNYDAVIGQVYGLF